MRNAKKAQKYCIWQAGKDIRWKRLSGARNYWNIPAASSNHAVSSYCSRLLCQKLAEILQLAYKQQIAWKIH